MLPTGKPEDVGMDSAPLGRAFELLRGWVEDGTLLGASALVARRGAVVGRRWFGDAVREPERKPVGPDTLFAAASVTTLFTATAIVQLAERGRISIDRPVHELLPEFADHVRPHRVLRLHALGGPGPPARLRDDRHAAGRERMGGRAGAAAAIRG
jgi:CubicO group peptidase (beta-lactamase class C family)